jgi:hypothetical protein
MNKSGYAWIFRGAATFMIVIPAVLLTGSMDSMAGGHLPFSARAGMMGFWAAAAAVVVAGSIYKQIVAMRGCCRRCGYCLTGNTSGVCPECGRKIAPKSVP